VNNIADLQSTFANQTNQADASYANDQAVTVCNHRKLDIPQVTVKTVLQDVSGNISDVRGIA